MSPFPTIYFISAFTNIEFLELLQSFKSGSSFVTFTILILLSFCHPVPFHAAFCRPKAFSSSRIVIIFYLFFNSPCIDYCTIFNFHTQSGPSLFFFRPFAFIYFLYIFSLCGLQKLGGGGGTNAKKSAVSFFLYVLGGALV